MPRIWVRNHWLFNVEYMDAEECVDFVSTSSGFYPELCLYYEEAAETWLVEQEVGEEGAPFC